MAPRNIIKHKIINLLQSFLILGGMIALTGFLGWFIAGSQGIKWALVLGIFTLALSPRISPHILLRMYRAEPLSQNEVPALYQALRELAHRADFPAVPKLYYIPSTMPNAFTMGNRNEATVALTDGLLKTLDFRELIGVLAHPRWPLRGYLVLNRSFSSILIFFQSLRYGATEYLQTSVLHKI